MRISDWSSDVCSSDLLFVQHGVAGDRVGEGVEFVLRGQLAVQEQIGDLHEGGLFRELADRITAMEQNALIAVYIGEPRFAARGRGEARIVGECPRLRVELADIDDLRPDRAR